ncbi:hypothetical protein QAD02_010331 [Eretmocerus hayati]|uniref:Uncharacterized protein n=1 Tax=Eretmocerus hayati TaxID=131215 RepID=A0ACC2NCJ2_9HYME|nr:hypothetical protein QAD02_010331 [Eretmocerus hayati]
MRSWDDDDTLLPQKSCSFNSGLSERQWKRKSLPIQLYYLGEERVLVIWDITFDDLTHKKILNVNMTACTTRSLHVNSLFNTYVIVHEKNYEVITSDPVQCSMTLKMCRLVYDQKGIPLRSIPFPAKIQRGILDFVSSKSVPEGFIFRQDISTVMKYVNSTGGTIELNTNFKGIPEISSIASSAEYNMYTICRVFLKNATHVDEYQESITRCDQFNVGDNRPKFHVNFEHFKPIKVQAVHNLKEGGFLLATLACDSYFNPLCKDYTVTRQRPGEAVVELDKKSIDLRCSGSLKNVVADSLTDSDRICFFFSCVHEIYDSRIRIKSVINSYEICE